ncbi:MAG: hypothetical protein AB7E24_25830 [Novosphingobium sp.]
MPRAWVTLTLVVASTVIGLMGTDLVLPAIPLYPKRSAAPHLRRNSFWLLMSPEPAPD